MKKKFIIWFIFVQFLLFGIMDIIPWKMAAIQKEREKIYHLYIWPCTPFEKGWKVKNIVDKGNEICFTIASSNREVTMSESVPHIILEEDEANADDKKEDDKVSL